MCDIVRDAQIDKIIIFDALHDEIHIRSIDIIVQSVLCYIVEINYVMINASNRKITCVRNSTCEVETDSKPWCDCEHEHECSIDSGIFVQQTPRLAIVSDCVVASLVAMAQPIALVSLGTKQTTSWLQVGEELAAGLKDLNKVSWHDLKELLANPKKKMKVQSEWGKDGSWDGTIQKVFMQEQFPEVVCDQVEALQKDPNLQVLVEECWSGFHRADTTCKALKSVLNSMHDADGNRMYNAEHFPLINIENPDQLREVVRNIQMWIEAPEYHAHDYGYL